MTHSAMPVRQVIGCDVGKDAIVAYDSLGGQVTELANHPETLKAFVDTLEPSVLIVCEATGGHEAGLLQAAVAAGVPAHRADARRVKAFIKLRLQRPLGGHAVGCKPRYVVVGRCRAREGNE